MSTSENEVFKIQRTIDALKRNNIDGFFVQTREQAHETVRSLVKAGDTVSCGGSVSLQQSGILDIMSSGEYVFIDRSKAKNPDEVRSTYLQAYGCDTFFTGVNAVTEQGELYNVDGNGNRVSAIVYGPKQVIVIAGVNKIVRDIDSAVYRVKTVAAPCNGRRMNLDTPCAVNGVCAGVNGKMTDGCSSQGRMCVHYLVSGYQRNKDRIKVIFLNESLGF